VDWKRSNFDDFNADFMSMERKRLPTFQTVYKNIQLSPRSTGKGEEGRFLWNQILRVFDLHLDTTAELPLAFLTKIREERIQRISSFYWIELFSILL